MPEFDNKTAQRRSDVNKSARAPQVARGKAVFTYTPLAVGTATTAGSAGTTSERGLLQGLTGRGRCRPDWTISSRRARPG
jgi:hypothetical protein